MTLERKHWDAVVLGAGPAGSTAALQLARAGAAVLLIDKARFPREKVCGCTVNAAAAQVLNSLQLGDLLPSLGAAPLDTFRLFTRGNSSIIPLPRAWGISRSRFDAALVDVAVAAGATFADGTSGHLMPHDGGDGPRIIELRGAIITRAVTASIVLGCTGLADRSLDDEPGLSPRIAARSHMGCATIAEGFPDFYKAGTIYMAHGRGGYVGLNQLEDGRLDIAAALSPSFVQAQGGPGPAVSTLLEAARLPVLPARSLTWRGTPLLTRRRRSVASHRLLLVGDAAGYAEPFTGEGIAWALASALAAVPIALRGIECWSAALENEWNRAHGHLLGPRIRRCKWLTRVMRPPIVTRIINRALSLAPAIARPFVRAINKPWPALSPLAAPAGARP